MNPDVKGLLEKRVGSALHLTPTLVNQSIWIEAHAGHVVLHGKVGSYYQKQMAQETARQVDGVAEIENQLEVSWT